MFAAYIRAQTHCLIDPSHLGSFVFGLGKAEDSNLLEDGVSVSGVSL